MYKEQYGEYAYSVMLGCKGFREPKQIIIEKQNQGCG